MSTIEIDIYIPSEVKLDIESNTKNEIAEKLIEQIKINKEQKIIPLPNVGDEFVIEHKGKKYYLVVAVVAQKETGLSIRVIVINIIEI
jgi:hypothetical protein